MANDNDLSWIEVNLSAVEANVRALREVLADNKPDTGTGGSKPTFCAVVKKNAYGLGAPTISHRLVKAGVDMLAVYSAGEAEELIKASVKAPIFVFMPVRTLDRTSVLYRHAVAGLLHLTVHDPSQLDDLERLGRTFSLQWPVHLYVDTGMSRGGLSPAQFLQMISDLAGYKHIRLAGVYTHPATADVDVDFLDMQMERLRQTLEQLSRPLPPQVMIHGANTYALLRDQAYHHDLVRPGLGLYGFGPEWLSEGRRLEPMAQLQPAVRWVSRITHVQRHDTGTVVGYGSTYRLTRPSILGIVPVGYGDGYPLALSNKAVVRSTGPTSTQATPINCPVLGQVNMDQITVDVTDLATDHDLAPEQLMDVQVEVYSDNPAAANHISNLALQANTHPYEILCRLNPRLTRRYLHNR